MRGLNHRSTADPMGFTTEVPLIEVGFTTEVPLIESGFNTEVPLIELGFSTEVPLIESGLSTEVPLIDSVAPAFSRRRGLNANDFDDLATLRREFWVVHRRREINA